MSLWRVHLRTAWQHNYGAHFEECDYGSPSERGVDEMQSDAICRNRVDVSKDKRDKEQERSKVTHIEQAGERSDLWDWQGFFWSAKPPWLNNHLLSSQGYFIWAMTFHEIYSCDGKAELSASLFQSSVSQDPSEIILIRWFRAQKHLSMSKTVGS